MQQIIYYRNKYSIKYRDFYFRLVACLVASHVVVAYGETMSFFTMLLMPYYYYALVPSFIIAFALFTLIRFINTRLDKNFDWHEQTIPRIGMQAFFGFIVPSICAFLLAFTYFTVRGVNIFSTTYLKYDFQFILLQLLLINLYYVAYYFYQKWSLAEEAISKLTVQHAGPIISKETFVVSKGSGNFLLQVDDIAYFFRNGENNYLRTVSGEDYFITSSLDEVQQQLAEDKFFRANRQLLMHRRALKGYSPLTYGKLEARLEPEYPGAVISQNKARIFKKWIEK